MEVQNDKLQKEMNYWNELYAIETGMGLAITSASISNPVSLSPRVAELVTISSPSDLHTAIRKVEEIEMARNLTSGGQTT